MFVMRWSNGRTGLKYGLQLLDWIKLVILLLGTVIEPSEIPALYPTGALETETNLDGGVEETEERMGNLKNDIQALEKLGRHKAFNSKHSK